MADHAQPEPHFVKVHTVHQQEMTGLEEKDGMAANEGWKPIAICSDERAATLLNQSYPRTKLLFSLQRQEVRYVLSQVSPEHSPVSLRGSRPAHSRRRTARVFPAARVPL